MNKGPKLYQFVGLTIVVLGLFMFGSMASALPPTVNNIATHASFDASAFTGSDAGCKACHPRSGQSTFATDSDLQVEQDMHVTHQNSRWLTDYFKKCVNCHRSSAVDNAKGINSSATGDTTAQAGWGSADINADGSSMGGLYNSNIQELATGEPGLRNGLPSRQNVSKAICNRCHGKFTTSIHGTNWILPANGGPFNCTTCHDGVTAKSPAQAHPIGRSTQNNMNDNSCLRCHGGSVKFETEESNRSLTGLINWTP